MQRQSNSLPRSIIFSLLAVPWSAGGLSAGGQTSSKGQRDKADTASLPQLVQPGLGLGAQSGAWGATASASLWHCSPRPSRHSPVGWEWLTSKCLISLHSSHLDCSEEAGIPVCLVFGWPFISGGRIRGNDDQTLSLGDSAESIMGFTQHCWGPNA